MFTLQIRRALLILALVPVILQPGMAQWAPPVEEGLFDHHATAAHAGPDHRHVTGAESATAVPESGIDGAGGRCRQPDIGCDCVDCMDYFIAHSLVIPASVSAPPQVPPPGRFADRLAVSFLDLRFAPLTPPPR